MDINSSNRKALGTFCYPSGLKIRKIKLNGSLSEI